MLLLKSNGYALLCLNLVPLFLPVLFCGVTTLGPLIFPPILFSMLAGSIWKLIFILFEIWLLPNLLPFDSSLVKINWQTSSPSPYLPPCLHCSIPSLMLSLYSCAWRGVLRIRSATNPKYESKLVVIKRSLWIPKFKRVVQIKLVIRTTVKDRLIFYFELLLPVTLSFCNL